jgi:hypothetical protein
MVIQRKRRRPGDAIRCLMKMTPVAGRRNARLGWDEIEKS